MRFYIEGNMTDGVRSDLVVRHEKTIHKDKYTKGIRPDEKAGTSVDGLGMDVTAGECLSA